MLCSATVDSTASQLLSTERYKSVAVRMGTHFGIARNPHQQRPIIQASSCSTTEKLKATPMINVNLYYV